MDDRADLRATHGSATLFTPTPRTPQWGRDRPLYRKVRGRTGRLRRRSVHRVRGPVVLRQRGDRVRRRHRVGAARRRVADDAPGRVGGSQPAAACGRHHRLHRRGPRRLDDLFVPVAGVDRPRHRGAGLVGRRGRRGGLDRRGRSRRPSARAARASPSRCDRPPSHPCKGSSAATQRAGTPSRNPVWHCRF